MTSDLAMMPAHQLVKLFKARKASPVEAVKAALARVEAFNRQLNAFQHLDPEGALKSARASEKRWRKGGERLSDIELSSGDEVETTARPQPKKVKADKKDSKEAKKDKKDKQEKKEKKEKRDKTNGTHGAKAESDDEEVTEDTSKTTNRHSEKRAKKDKKRSRDAEDEEAESTTAHQNGSTKPHDAAESTTPSSKKRKADDDAQTATKKLKPAASSADTTAAAASSADQPDANGNPPLSSFPIHATTLALLHKKGITHAFPIQAATFHQVFACKDVVGRARTGTGKVESQTGTLNST